MINTNVVNEFLQSNTISPIIDHFLLITTTAQLLSYSVPQNITKFRAEAALAANAWKKYEPQNPDDEDDTNELNTLTIEMPSGNIIIRSVQTKLLLVLVGFNDTLNERDDFADRFHAEYEGHDQYPNHELNPEVDVTNSGTELTSILQIQRQKLDTMINWLSKELENRNFIFKDD